MIDYGNGQALTIKKNLANLSVPIEEIPDGTMTLMLFDQGKGIGIIVGSNRIPPI